MKKYILLGIVASLASCTKDITPTPSPEQAISSAPARENLAPGADAVRNAAQASSDAGLVVEQRTQDLRRQVAEARVQAAKADSEIRRLTTKGFADRTELIALGTQVEQLLVANDTLEADFEGMRGEMQKWREAHSLAVIRANELFAASIRKDEEVADLRRERDDLRAQVARLEKANRENAIAAQKGQIDGASAKGEAKSWKTIGWAVFVGVFLLALVGVVIKKGFRL